MRDRFSIQVLFCMANSAFTGRILPTASAMLKAVISRIGYQLPRCCDDMSSARNPGKIAKVIVYRDKTEAAGCQIALAVYK